MIKFFSNFLGIFLFIFLLIGCNSKGEDIILFDDKIVIEEKMEIDCNPFLKRKYRSASIMIKIEKDFEAVHPYKFIKLEDAQNVKIDVVLVSKKGKKFNSNIIGMAVGGQSGKMIDVRFDPQIPSDVLIKEIQIFVDNKITVKKILWHDYNYK